jgi:branched-chain amino acid transport system substrate-binding protein
MENIMATRKPVNPIRRGYFASSIRSAAVRAAAVIFSASGLAIAPTFTPADAAETLKIGFIGTFSGPGTAFGQDMLNGFMLALDELGGKLGGLEVQLSKNDDQWKPDVAKQVAEKLVTRDHVDLVAGVYFSNILVSIYPTVIESKTILVSGNAGPSTMAGKDCSPYFFTTSWQSDQLSKAMGKYMSEHGMNRVVTVVSNYQAGIDALSGFKSGFKGTIVSEIMPTVGQLDYSAELARISSQKPDAVFAFIAGGASVNFVKQYAQAGLMKTIPFHSIFTISATNLAAIGNVAIGTKSINGWTEDFDTAQNKQFVADFKKKYNQDPGINSANAYDSALLIDQAIRDINGKIEDRAAFIHALEQAKFRSVRGSFKFNNNHFPIQTFYQTVIAKAPDGHLYEARGEAVLPDDMDAYHDQCPMK